jgi:2-polyprenyl-3-methyl-5-hydroxy-6-metoxy-1,4-benzoquinol methylase
MNTVFTFIKNNNIKTVLDYGCGDWQFSKIMPWTRIVDNYLGVDIVESLIKHNQTNFTKPGVEFQMLDSTWAWPTVDLILCKDVLQHLSNDTVFKLLKKMKQHSKYILITNDINGENINGNCNDGGYRPIDLTKEPWNKPSEVIGNFWYHHQSDAYHKQTIVIHNQL